MSRDLSYSSHPHLWAFHYVFGPFGFWAVGALTCYFSLQDDPASRAKVVIGFVGLMVAFFWVGVAGFRQRAYSALYVVLVFIPPVIASVAALAIAFDIYNAA